MLSNMALAIIHLEDLLKEVGEEKCREVFSDFSCPLDNDVEFFLKEKAILFHKMNISRTFLVFAPHKGQNVLVGYFAIAIKVLPIKKGTSATLRRKLTGFKDKEAALAILIGQLAKNFHNGYNQLISGQDLLCLAMQKVKELHRLGGCRVVLLECKPEPKLIDFYRRNGFIPYDQDEKTGLVQLIRYIDKPEA